ncbi:uncharacterized protein LOC141588643 [Silene latifolia]|uniref:uncharacterized protein LOC141588643 n=1 Tax=Silene latifolia TaxID=37657 RepID=UPI003D7846B9
MSDREKKSETVVKPRVLPINMPKQKSLSHIALEEFLSRDFLNNVTVCTISAVGHDDKEKVKENEADDAVPSQQLQSYPQKENEVVKALNALPANMGWRQIFHLPKEKRHIILQGLDKPELYAGKIKDVGELAEQSTQCVSCNAALTFSDEDLLLGSKPHNRPLYVSGYIRGQKVNKILIHGGSGVNLMPKATMKELGIAVDELSSSRTIIHGFNLNGERAIGMIRVNLSMGDLSSETLFYVIEAKTSFKKINGDAKPFTKVDSFFADAKFFEENGTSSEFMPTTISSTGKGGYDFIKPTPLGKVVEVEPYGLNKMQQELFKQEGSFKETKTGLGYKSPTPVKISARKNRTTTSSQHITIEEAEENEAEDIKTLSTSSVFDKISSPAQRSRPSVFDRLGRLSLTKNRPSVFTRLDKRGTNEIKSSTPPPCTRKKESKPPSSHSRDAKDLEIVNSYHITAEEIPDDSEEVEADKAPKTLEDEVQSTVDDLKELNLGTDEDPRPIYVSALLTKEEEEEYYKLLVEYKDVFAWSYKEMSGLSLKIAVHRLSIRKGISPRKQSQRRFRIELILEIEKEVNKLIEVGFIREVRYPTWIVNIVPDDFPLPVTELMIDATTGHEGLSFMDCTAGYNQIQMAPEDQEATAFRTPNGIFCYTVMPFGLKKCRGHISASNGKDL